MHERLIRKNSSLLSESSTQKPVSDIKIDVLYSRNKIVPCKQIPGIDLNKWLDPKCYPSKNNQYVYPVKKDQYNYPGQEDLYDYLGQKDQNDYSINTDQSGYTPGNIESDHSVKKHQDDYAARKDQYHPVTKDQYNINLRTSNYNPLWGGIGYVYQKK